MDEIRNRLQGLHTRVVKWPNSQAHMKDASYCDSLSSESKLFVAFVRTLPHPDPYACLNEFEQGDLLHSLLNDAIIDAVREDDIFLGNE